MKQKYMQMLLEYVNRECFPKVCNNCQAAYPDDERYTALTTDRLPIYEAEGEFNSHGLIAFFRNCSCNSTLVISLEHPEKFGSGLDDFLDFARYIKDRAEREKRHGHEVLEEFKQEYNHWILNQKK